jgi:formylglycine-generating enzyme required for sulfatase activity
MYFYKINLNQLIMKTKTILFSVLIILISFVFLSSVTTLKPVTKSDFKIAFLKFDNKLYASLYELTNVEYREFLQYLKSTKKNDDYKKCLYDSTQWVKKFPHKNHEPFQSMYHMHPAYDNYPVVNITKEAADLYCEWRTEKYNASADKKYKKVVFRLPTETEWEKLAAPLPGHNLPWYGNFPYKSDDEKTALANIKVKDYVTGNDDYSFSGGSGFPLNVGHYKANNLGICDVIGNVSELTQSGAQKGGCWDNYLDECTVDKVQNYELPDPRVGFRVIMEVIEE